MPLCAIEEEHRINGPQEGGTFACAQLLCKEVNKIRSLHPFQIPIVPFGCTRCRDRRILGWAYRASLNNQSMGFTLSVLSVQYYDVDACG
jgi:hypothetical protein